MQVVSTRDRAWNVTTNTQLNQSLGAYTVRTMELLFDTQFPSHCSCEITVIVKTFPTEKKRTMPTPGWVFQLMGIPDLISSTR